jgi:integrase
LYLRIGPTGTKSWVFRFKHHGRLREMGLGSLTAVGLASARQSAAEAREAHAKGRDPIEARRAARATESAIPNFATAAAVYIAEHRKAWKSDKHADQWTNTLATYAEPVIGKRAVDAITTDDILRVLKPIWSNKTETATRLRQRIECVIDAEFARHRIERLNPARWKGHLDKLLPKPTKLKKRGHMAALPYADMPEFVRKLRKEYGNAARALEFLILTACRSNEVRYAVRSEVHGDAWTIPKERMKGGVAHTVPLSWAAIAVLGKCPARGLLFPYEITGKALSENAMRALLIRMDYGHVTAHGFRSSFRDWAAEETDTLNIVAEKALAHVIPNEAEAAYRRGELLRKRRELMDAWAEYLAEK